MAFFRDTFGRNPDGYWLPECAFQPGIEKYLIEAGVKKTAVSTHAIGTFHTGIKSGKYMHKELELYVQDHRLSSYIWKVKKETLPANPVYREFYRDLGMDVVPEYFENLGIDLSDDQKKNGVWTGIKYFSCSTPDVELSDKPLYNPDAVGEQTRIDASYFISRVNEKRDLYFDKQSCIIAFDTEILGHWWYEGVDWFGNMLNTDMDKKNEG